MEKVKIVYASGKRKRAIARATLRPGHGLVTINGVPLRLIQPEPARLKIMEALQLAGKAADSVDVSVRVKGGGWSAQADVARLAIAKSLVEFSGSEELKNTYLNYDRHLLVADTRRKEPKKPGTHSHARSKRQKSYR